MFKKLRAVAALSVLFVLSALSALFPFTSIAPPATVSAEESASYARIVQEDVWLYESASDGAGLFILPRTYFVRVTGDAGDYYAVEYLSGSSNAVRGYCKKSEAELVDYIPVTPFLVYEVEVTYTADGGLMPDSPLGELTFSACYYGSFPYGSALCYYVGIDGKRGYVPASACSVVSYPENTEHTETEEDPAPNPSVSAGAGAVSVVLICALAVAGVGALYFLFRPVHTKKIADPFGEDAEDAY